MKLLTYLGHTLKHGAEGFYVSCADNKLSVKCSVKEEHSSGMYQIKEDEKITLYIYVLNRNRFNSSIPNREIAYESNNYGDSKKNPDKRWEILYSCNRMSMSYRMTSGKHSMKGVSQTRNTISSMYILSKCMHLKIFPNYFRL